MTSSIIIPQPPDNFSIDFTGNGLKISKILKRIRPITNIDMFTGIKVNVIHWPTHSSMTIREGSFSFVSLIIFSHAMRPIINNNKVIMGNIIGDTESKRKNHVREAARLDHVPGAKGSLPI